MRSHAPAEPDVTGFEATVEEIDGRSVVLSETYFYPESGGQPADRGFLGEVAVDHVRETTEAVVHELAEAPPFEVGAPVVGSIDPDFRTYCRRAHTASHALFGAGRRLFCDLGYGGFGITAEKVRVDLSTPSTIDDESLVELERLVNRTIWDGRDVTWQQVPKDEALAREDVAFNASTEEGVTGTDEIRLVEIADWDVAACGGTHVRNTAEIGPVTVLERSNPGEGLTRVTFAVGPAAIDRRAAEARATRGAALALDVPVTAVDEGARRLASERDDLEAIVADLREQVVAARLADLTDETVRRDGREWLVGAVPTADANALAEFAQRAVADDSGGADVVALVGEDGGYLAVASEGSVDAGAVVEDVTDEFGGGGGGSPTVAQGGGLTADPEDIVDYLRE